MLHCEAWKRRVVSIINRLSKSADYKQQGILNLGDERMHTKLFVFEKWEKRFEMVRSTVENGGGTIAQTNIWMGTSRQEKTSQAENGQQKEGRRLHPTSAIFFGLVYFAQ